MHEHNHLVCVQTRHKQSSRFWKNGLLWQYFSKFYRTPFPVVVVHSVIVIVLCALCESLPLFLLCFSTIRACPDESRVLFSHHAHSVSLPILILEAFQMAPDVTGSTLDTEIIQADMLWARATWKPSRGVTRWSRNANCGTPSLANLLEHLENGLLIQTLVISIDA